MNAGVQAVGHGQRATHPPVDPQRAWRHRHAASAAPCCRASRVAWHFARGNLRVDPPFRGVLARGHLPACARVVDIGCGQALLQGLGFVVHSAPTSPGTPVANVLQAADLGPATGAPARSAAARRSSSP